MYGTDMLKNSYITALALNFPCILLHANALNVQIINQMQFSEKFVVFGTEFFSVLHTGQKEINYGKIT